MYRVVTAVGSVRVLVGVLDVLRVVHPSLVSSRVRVLETKAASVVVFPIFVQDLLLSFLLVEKEHGSMVDVINRLRSTLDRREPLNLSLSAFTVPIVRIDGVREIDGYV